MSEGNTSISVRSSPINIRARTDRRGERRLRYDRLSGARGRGQQRACRRYGNSYPGFYALMAAASGTSRLESRSPQAPVTDWFMGDDTHHNGVLFLRDAFSFIGGSFGRPMDNPTTEAAAAPRYVRTDEYDFFLRKATVDSLTQLLGDTVRFWNEMMRHPDYDDWWRERCSVRAMHDLRPAILVGRPVRCRGLLRRVDDLRLDPAPEPPHVVPDGRRPVGARRLAVVERRQPARQDALRRRVADRLLPAADRSALFQLLPARQGRRRRAGRRYDLLHR